MESITPIMIGPAHTDWKITPSETSSSGGGVSSDVPMGEYSGWKCFPLILHLNLHCRTGELVIFC